MNEGTPEALAGLHDVVAPAAVSWAPQTLGWAVLAGALVVALGWFGWRAWKRAKANRYRKVALSEIGRIERALQDDPSSGGAVLGAVNEILKRAAPTAWPRRSVASLAGQDWLAFLDATADTGDFRSGPGRVLADQVYAPAGVPASGEERAAFFGAVRHWIRHHRRSDTTADASVPGQTAPAGRAPLGEGKAA